MTEFEMNQHIAQGVEFKKYRRDLFENTSLNESFTSIHKKHYNANANDNADATLSGKIETSNLMMTSQYYHYLVYFLLAVTLIAFTFNILLNPAANVMPAVVVVSALLFVFFISRAFSF